jgi:hypothetical protein
LPAGPVSATGVPNQEIDLPNNVKLILNEQVAAVDDTDGTITLNALHLYVNPVVDFRIASAQAGIAVSPNGSPAPEPSTLGLLGVGIALLFIAMSLTCCGSKKWQPSNDPASSGETHDG